MLSFSASTISSNVGQSLVSFEQPSAQPLKIVGIWWWAFLEPEWHEINLATDRINVSEYKAKLTIIDEDNRVVGIVASILVAMHMRNADDLFGGPQGSPRTDKLISASAQWAERIMEKIDERFSCQPR